MVPSWTETLLVCGANVVGRTRFCVHPEGLVQRIPVVGGTKDLNMDSLRNLEADLLLLDQEENTLDMAKASPFPVFATHVTGIKSVASELERMAAKIRELGDTEFARAAEEIVARWQTVSRRPAFALQEWSELPGVIEWVRKPAAEPSASSVIYMIWKKPWMAIAPGTFISSVLERVGLTSATLWAPAGPGSLYPQIDLTQVPRNTVFLMSSEPYPFHKKRQWISELPFPAAIVDGESYSWFGIRSLRFLENAKGPKSAAR